MTWRCGPGHPGELRPGRRFARASGPRPSRRLSGGGAWFFTGFPVILILVSASPEGFLNSHTNANLTAPANKNLTSRGGIRWCLIIATDTNESMAGHAKSVWDPRGPEVCGTVRVKAVSAAGTGAGPGAGTRHLQEDRTVNQSRALRWPCWQRWGSSCHNPTNRTCKMALG